MKWFYKIILFAVFIPFIAFAEQPTGGPPTPPSPLLPDGSGGYTLNGLLTILTGHTLDIPGITDNNIPKMGPSGFEDSALSEDAQGKILAVGQIISEIYTIGTPGRPGFGVAAYQGTLPSGFTALDGSDNPLSANYGNYQYDDGSIMVWIPKFYYRIFTGSLFPANWIDVKGADFFASTAAANAAGYALHRAFIDGGIEQDGFFIDKYKCSKAASGAGYIASSIRNGDPISAHPDHNPIADLTACSGNYYYETINAAHARDGVDGAVNPSSIFHVTSRFQYSALAMLAMAHAQATAAATLNNAWWSSSYPYPKGCNNNALADTDDTSVTFTSDGYSNACKTGSGVPFAKTTHNGQACGVADLNGLMYEVSLGVTCIASGKTITGATQANPCQITAVGHGRSTGDYVMVTGVGGMTELNDKLYQITVVDSDNFTLDDINATGYSAYTAGGTATVGDFYVAKQATAMADFTSGNSGATDHWGSTGVAAMMESFSPAFKSGGEFALRYGSGSNQVLSGAASGNGWLLTGLGFPMSGDGIDSTGTSTFGKDYFYQYVRNELCLLSCASWSVGSFAGVWNVFWNNFRTYSGSTVGFRCGAYVP